MKSLNVVVFDGLTGIDAFGPVEVLLKVPDTFSVNWYSMNGGEISNSIGLKIDTLKMEENIRSDVLIVPGGFGTRKLVEDHVFLQKLDRMSVASEYVLSICTGSALLAKAGFLDGRSATGNKTSWEWVISQSKNVNWIRKARWVVDDKVYTSSGVTAGMDMAFGFLSDVFGNEIVKKISHSMEYVWNSEKENDMFSDM